VLLQDELENRINYYLKNQPFPLHFRNDRIDLAFLKSFRLGPLIQSVSNPIHVKGQQIQFKQHAQTNAKDQQTNKQTNKQTNR